MTLVTIGWRVLCALVSVAVLALWVRTYSVSDAYSWTAHVRVAPGSDADFSTMPVREMVSTAPGRLLAHRQSPFG